MQGEEARDIKTLTRNADELSLGVASSVASLTTKHIGTVTLGSWLPYVEEAAGRRELRRGPGSWCLLADNLRRTKHAKSEARMLGLFGRTESGLDASGWLLG